MQRQPGHVIRTDPIESGQVHHAGQLTSAVGAFEESAIPALGRANRQSSTRVRGARHRSRVDVALWVE